MVQKTNRESIRLGVVTSNKPCRGHLRGWRPLARTPHWLVTTKIISMRLLKLVLSIVIVIASAILCQQIISNSIADQKNKNDYAELNSAQYGLLSVDEWKNKITPIMESEINKMYLPKAKKRVLKKHVEAMLNTLIDKVYQRIKEQNEGTLEGRAKQSLIRAFVKLDDVKKGIPEYADAIIHEMTKPATTREIKGVLKQQIKAYAKKTYDTQDTSLLDGILHRTHSESVEAARTKIAADIAIKKKMIGKEAIALIVLAVALFALSGLSQKPLSPSQYILLVLLLIVLLIVGVTTPMIDMEAKIPQLSLALMGYPVHFDNQVLYFQSKSILDVFWIMITDDKLQMKFVGVLLVTFSIFFPVLKILSSLAHYYNFSNARENAAIRFFVFKSGKWSMADVMVVAIFMAYIGFNGIITSEFDKLKSATQEVTLLTTNATSLQPGFYLFLTYTLLSLFLSGFLARKSPVAVSSPK